MTFSPTTAKTGPTTSSPLFASPFAVPAQQASSATTSSRLASERLAIGPASQPAAEETAEDRLNHRQKIVIAGLRGIRTGRIGQSALRSHKPSLLFMRVFGTRAAIKKVFADPFNAFEENHLVSLILRLGGNPDTALMSKKFKECAPRGLNRSLLQTWMREPIFCKLIQDVIAKNPGKFSAIEEAIRLNKPELFPEDRGNSLEQCTQLVDLVCGPIQYIKDANFIRFFPQLLNSLKEKDRPLDKDCALSYAEGYREWMAKNQGILNGIEKLNLQGCLLEVLPPELFNLVNLKELNLSRLFLSRLSERFIQLQKLRTLDLSLNPRLTKITALAPLRLLKNLQELILQAIDFDEDDEWELIGQFKHLNRLVLPRLG